MTVLPFLLIGLWIVLFRFVLVGKFKRPEGGFAIATFLLGMILFPLAGMVVLRVVGVA